MEKINWNNISEKFTTLIFYLSILFFFIAFNFQDSKTGGWYQQNMPNLNGVPLTDIFFADSLNGFATTGNENAIDTSYLLKTTNGGDNWNIIFTEQRDFARAYFFNKDTGIVCGGHGNGAILYKTTNAGIIWISLNTPGGGLLYLSDMKVFSLDTIWVTETNTMVGGIFLTTNGGISWENRSNGLLAPLPNKIYFYNSRIGFASGYNGSRLFRTTNSGINWVSIPGINGFYDIVFVDSLTGYKTLAGVKKTTDGGTTWIEQQRPNLNFDNSFSNLTVVNNDTLWSSGGSIITLLGSRGVIYKTTNGGLNWGYQVPDSININIPRYIQNRFINKRVGWAYINGRGVHTTVGGNDTTFFTNIKEQITNISFYYELGQNFPNPFNPKTVIGYSLLKNGFVKIIVFDILGKEVATLVNGNKKAGKYETQFSINQYTINGNSSGVYFYTLFVDGVRVDTKKMLLIK